MRHVFVVLLLTCLSYSERLHSGSRAECVARSVSVTVQIHDYEHLPSDWLSRASAIVTRVYERVGVHVEWHPVLRHQLRRGRAAAGSDASSRPVAQIAVIIPTAEMTARGRVAEGVMGYAAVGGEGEMGRIAYVIYDRVRQIAAAARLNEIDLLAFVIAHETGHLLLGRGSGTIAGLMKCQWDWPSIQQLKTQRLEFSELQAARIRNTLEIASAAIPAGMPTASRVESGCQAPMHADQR